MELGKQIPRSVRTEWLSTNNNNFRIGSHPNRRGHVLIETDRICKVHGMECILSMIKYGRTLGKPWATQSDVKITEDKVSVTIRSDNPLYLVAEALDIYQAQYRHSEEIFNIDNIECIHLVAETSDYKALCNMPIKEDVIIPYYPCTVHLVEVQDGMFVPVMMTSIDHGLGRYRLDMDKYFILINPIGLDTFDIDGTMLAIPTNKINERIGHGVVQIIKEVPGMGDPHTYDESRLTKYMPNTTSH